MPSALLVCPSTSDKPERIERTRLDSSELAANQRATPYLTDDQLKAFFMSFLLSRFHVIWITLGGKSVQIAD
jgi:hypothetical protein